MVTDLVKTNASRGVPPPSGLPEINIWSRKDVADMTGYETHRECANAKTQFYF